MKLFLDFAHLRELQEPLEDDFLYIEALRSKEYYHEILRQLIKFCWSYKSFSSRGVYEGGVFEGGPEGGGPEVGDRRYLE